MLSEKLIALRLILENLLANEYKNIMWYICIWQIMHIEHKKLSDTTDV